MKMKRQIGLYSIICVSFIFLAAVLSACDFISGERIYLSSENNDESYGMPVGGKGKIELEGNPTTGYQWQVASNNDAVLELTYEPDYKCSSKKIGAGGVYTFKFKAVASGSSEINLVYVRSWEEGIPPLETFSVLIMVE